MAPGIGVRDVYGELKFVCAHVSASTAKTMLSAVVAEKIAPKILSEAIIDSGAVRKCVQGEALRLILVRVSLNRPEYLGWLTKIVSNYLTSHAAGEALETIGGCTLTSQALALGLKGNIVSAMVTAAIQASIETCRLLAGRVCLKHSLTRRVSFAQYRYNMATLACTGLGTVVGGSVGAALGTMVAPGFGTILGSLVCSCSGGWLPGYLRDKKGPDKCYEQHQKELAAITPLCMRTTCNDFVELSFHDDDEAICDGDDGDATSFVSLMKDEGAVEDSCLVLRSRQYDASSGEAAQQNTVPSATPDGADGSSCLQRSVDNLASAIPLDDLSNDAAADTIGRADGSPFGANASQSVALAGKLEDLGKVQNWDDVSRRINKCGENELVLVFWVG